MSLSWLKFANILLAALLAGTSFGIWIGFDPKNYSASTYIEQQQHLVLSLNTLMISLVVFATVVTFTSAYLQRKNKTIFFTLLFAATLFLACMAITRFGNVPIQSEMLNWTKSSMPDNWTVLRDQWWSFHIMRTLVELIALVLVAWTLVQNKILKTE